MSLSSVKARRYTPEPKRTRLSADERHGQLLDVGAALVGEHGAAALTMDGLASAAKVSRALVYQHFADAGELLVELLEREWTWLEERISAGLASAETFSDKVRAATFPYLAAKAERGPVFRALLLDRPENAAVRAAMLDYGGRVIGFWTREGKREFGLDRITAESAAVILIGGFEFAALRYWSTDVDLETELGTFVDMVMSSLEGLVRRRKEKR